MTVADETIPDRPKRRRTVPKAKGPEMHKADLAQLAGVAARGEEAQARAIAVLFERFAAHQESCDDYNERDEKEKELARRSREVMQAGIDGLTKSLASLQSDLERQIRHGMGNVEQKINIVNEKMSQVIEESNKNIDERMKSMEQKRLEEKVDQQKFYLRILFGMIVLVGFPLIGWLATEYVNYRNAMVSNPQIVSQPAPQVTIQLTPDMLRNLTDANNGN